MGIYSLITTYSGLIAEKIPYFSVSFITAIVYVWLFAFFLMLFHFIFRNVKFKSLSDQNLLLLAFTAIFVVFIVDYFFQFNKSDLAFSSITKIATNVEETSSPNELVKSPTFSIKITDPKSGQVVTLNISTDVYLDQDLSTTSNPTFASLNLQGNLNLGSNTIAIQNTRLISNLNADLLDNKDSTYFLPLANLEGTSGYVPRFESINSTTDSIIYASSTGVGLRTTSILEALNIDGRIYLTDTGAPGDAANKIYNAGGLLFWNGIDLTSSAGLPAGSSGQTIRNNGAGWVATSNLYNDGTNVGIGTTSLRGKLDVVEATTFPKTMISFRRPGAGDWGITLGNETVSNVYIGYTGLSGGNVSDYFWRANWNTANVAVNTLLNAGSSSTPASRGLTTANM